MAASAPTVPATWEFFNASQQYPPSLGGQARTPTQQQIANLVSTGRTTPWTIPGAGQAYPLSTRPAQPYMPTQDEMTQVFEKKSIFRAEEVFASMLGPGGVSPLEMTERTSFTIHKFVLGSHLPNIRPARGRVGYGSWSYNQSTASLSAVGSGAEFTYQLLRTPQGMELLRLTVEQMNTGIVDFLLLTAYATLQNADDYGYELWKGELGRANAMGLSLEKLMERTNFLFGATHKLENPIQAIIRWVVNKQKLTGGVTSDALVMHHHIADHLHLTHPEYLEFFRAGPAGPGQPMLTEAQAFERHMPENWQLNVVRANVVDGVSEFDFMADLFFYGEFYVMQYNGADGPEELRSIDIYDQTRDSQLVNITLEEALVKSGRFDENGNLKSITGTHKSLSGPIQPATGGKLPGKDVDASGKFIDTFVGSGPLARSDGKIITDTSITRINELSRNDSLPLWYIGKLARLFEDEKLRSIKYSQRVIAKQQSLLQFPSGGSVDTGVSSSLASGQDVIMGTNPEAVMASIKSELTGDWSLHSASGKLRLNPATQNAALVRVGALALDGDSLNVAQSQSGAKKALALMRNISAPTPAETAGYNAILTGMKHIKTARATRDTLSEHIGAYYDHLVDSGVISSDTGSSPNSRMPSPHTAVQAVGAFISANPDRFTITSDDYARLAQSGTSSSLSTRQIGTMLVADGIPSSPDSIIERAGNPGSPESKQALTNFLNAPLTLQNMRILIANRIPLPFKVVLVRPDIIMKTYGMIACKRGAQRTYIGNVIFSWNDDGVAQVVRATLSMNSGGVVNVPETIFMLPHVTIAEILCGWSTTFRRENNLHTPFAQLGKDYNGDILVLLEPLDSPLGLNTSEFTLRGSWEEVFGADFELHQRHKGRQYWNREWVDKYYGLKMGAGPSLIDPKARGKRNTDYICYAGGMEYRNAAGNKEVRVPSGPFNGMAIYGAGMNAAFKRCARTTTQAALPLKQ